MMRLLAGIWICLVALGSSYGMTVWKLKEAAVVNSPPPPKGLEMRKLKMISVPIIANGVVQGYVVAQISFTVEPEALKKMDFAPDPFVQDEAFRTIYADDKLDFKHLERYDLNKFTKDVKAAVAKRMKSDVVDDVLVQEFNYVPVEDIRK